MTQSDTLFPIAKRIFAQTIGTNLVSVDPIGPLGHSKKEIERMISEIKNENRDSKIDSIINNKEYFEKKLEDHPDYKYSDNIHYMHYTYDNSSDTINIDAVVKPIKNISYITNNITINQDNNGIIYSEIS